MVNKEKKEEEKMSVPRAIGQTFFYFAIMVLLVLIYGFHDMSAGPFIYTEF
ncbi:MAG: teichoic acid D-Ala incorporation-associated protein DltX [Kurthia gibsonii]|uniref:Teichoic acid D-Ala incorporation-associated protein DltX n=1 Tax=Kurthia gibsonii TaxID=33946 RepID=A0ABU9LP51_9BACL|nr:MULTISPECIES: teichoic acid D-Ala incorporation-associated protein DltX [Kurthia]AMA62986.1 D-Ala-teichoic acid biosynthesis family protein [Kurthia sp. 11kri321]MEB6113902.1 teichoic acid D-Ala incorporation-associated protein DltX [Kurthia gibsonii]WIL38201.1 teichoic acid D-Ala incorporation-associated protein DltX [Kurthia sp. YJT4]GED19930.1 hypothetical protein KGI01_16710 [Kurthia gibsonii]HZG12350.1 teichoic acid D-Ala incorporation-associated protein DltX [Kurthia gibsonii]